MPHPRLAPDGLIIKQEDPAQPDVVELMRHGEAFSASLYPLESRHHLALDGRRRPEARFLVARDGQGKALATGALVLHGDWAEIKRMWVEEAARGQGIARRVLNVLVAQAASAGIAMLRLETGAASHAALSLYEQTRFKRRGPFADYRPDPLSVFIAFSALVLVTGLVVAFGKKDWLLGGPLAALAAAAIVWQIHGLLSGEPFLRLSPAGLRLNLDGRVFLDIPWREVEAISSLDLTFEVLEKRVYDLQGGTSPGYFLGKDQYRDVTALQVCEAFHDQTILPLWRAVAGTRGLRRLAGVGMATFMLPRNATASGLSNIFPTHDGKRFVTLPHRVLSVDRDQLRAEVEARWRAFGKRTDTGARRP